ncbi:MAG: sugar ABC transporter permease [Chloroflexota bacterium]|nr:sugar ABC transporter permease [Chloroflexota bacterium]MDP9471549.1 sugar ABC transporter permease [Chloroflexota bacterium]
MATTELSQAGRTSLPRTGRLSRRQALWGYLLIAPMMLGFGVFFLVALVAAIGLTLTNWNVLTSPGWVGLENYSRLFRDDVFWTSLRNTAALTVPHVVLRIAIALALALALNSNIRFRSIYRAVFFMPVLTMPVATATVWQWLYDPTYGPINYGLRELGLPRPTWLSNPDTALWAVLVVLLWSGVGYDMILFLAGLQNIPRDYYEAAQLDGAGAWRRFRDITFPLLTPTTFFLTVIAIISSLQVFDQVYVMTQVEHTTANTFPTIVYYIYEEAFRNFRMGYATTVAMVLLVLILLFTVLQFRLQRRWVHYT